MTIVTFPPTARIADIKWNLDRPAQVNRSAYTGRRKVMADPWHGRWTAEIELAPIVGEAGILAWRSFLAQLRGQANVFRLRANEKAQPVSINTGIIVSGSGAAAGSTSMFTVNWVSPGMTVAKAGMMITVNDQLCVLTADVVSNEHQGATVQFEPPLRAAAALGTAVEVVNPTALVALASSTAGWSVAKGQVYGIRLSVEEAF